MAFKDFFANMFGGNKSAAPTPIEPAQGFQGNMNLSDNGRYVNGTMNQDQYADYLRKDAAGELTRHSIYGNDQPIVSTNASNIHEVDLMGQNLDDFWSYKEQKNGHSKADYMELASHIPEVQERMNAGESLSSLEQDPVVGECAKQYFDPANMPVVSQYGDTFIAGDGNRHRILAAQEMGYDMPVRVGNVYEPNGQMQSAGSHIPQSDYGTVGNPYPQNTAINVPTQEKFQAFSENAARSQATPEPYRATQSAAQASPEPYHARSNTFANAAPTSQAQAKTDPLSNTNTVQGSSRSLSQDLHNENLFHENQPGNYTYQQSEYGKSASGSLELQKGERNAYAQRTVGGEDRLARDDGGHLIGNRFHGDGGYQNLEAQDRSLNRGAYKQKENEWADSLEQGDKAFVNTQSYRSNGSERPDAFMGYQVTEHADGSREWDAFSYQNQSPEEQAAQLDEVAQLDNGEQPYHNAMDYPEDYNPADYDEETTKEQASAPENTNDEAPEKTENPEKTEAPEEAENTQQSQAPEEAENVEKSEAPEETENTQQSEAPEKDETTEESQGQKDVMDPEESENQNKTEAPDESQSQNKTEEPEKSQSQENTSNQDQSQNQSQNQSQDQSQDQSQNQAQDQSQNNDYDYDYGYGY